MTENPTFPESEPLAGPATFQPSPPARARTPILPWLSALGFLILAGGLYYLWQYPTVPVETESVLSELHVAEQKLSAVDSRVGRIEQLPNPPSAADLGKISARIDALEARIADQTQFSSRLDVLSGRIESLSGRDQTAIDATKQQIDKASGQIATLEKSSANLETLSGRVNRLVRIQAAVLALATGRPLGSLPNAPPALSRYADVAPPTEAQLRLSFPQVEHAAVVANPISNANGPFVDRVLERAQDLITVRRGDDVVVGSQSSVAISSARVALDAGDLPAAVQAVAAMNPTAGSAAAEWLKNAKALVDARTALADMAAHV